MSMYAACPTKGHAGATGQHRRPLAYKDYFSRFYLHIWDNISFESQVYSWHLIRSVAMCNDSSVPEGHRASTNFKGTAHLKQHSY